MPIVGFGALVFGERITAMPSAVALGSLAYQTVVVGATFSLWFALIVKFSASRLSAFTFLTPLFGVAAGHLVLGEPLTPGFCAGRGAGGGGPRYSSTGPDEGYICSHTGRESSNA